MTTDAFVGKIYFERGSGSSPESFTRICQVFSISGLGETSELIDATSFCSGGYKEYIPGLSDGEEISIECNYEQDDTNLGNLIADVKAKATRSYQVVVEDSSPDETFAFDAVPLSWVLNPAVDNRNTITFTFKISGEITIS